MARRRNGHIRIGNDLEALVAVCQAHRDVWCVHGSSNQAMARLFNSVELLGRVTPIDEPEPPKAWPVRDETFLLSRLVERVTYIYDTLDQGERSGLPVADVLALIPPRQAMPTEVEDLLVYCRQVHAPLLAEPELCSKMGVLPHQLVVLNASIRQVDEESHQKPIPLIQSQKTYSTYERQLNACLRALIEGVDIVMTRYKKHKVFVAQYRKARRALQNHVIAARKTWYVDRVGIVSGRYVDAKQLWSVEEE